MGRRRAVQELALHGGLSRRRRWGAPLGRVWGTRRELAAPACRPGLPPACGLRSLVRGHRRQNSPGSHVQEHSLPSLVQHIAPARRSTDITAAMCARAQVAIPTQQRRIRRHPDGIRRRARSRRRSPLAARRRRSPCTRRSQRRRMRGSATITVCRLPRHRCSVRPNSCCHAGVSRLTAGWALTAAAATAPGSNWAQTAAATGLVPDSSLGATQGLNGAWQRA